MTTARLVYVVGQPGAGKSTLMAALTREYHRTQVEGPVPHDILTHPVTGAVVGAEMGRRRETFSGTDALASSIITQAVPWIQHVPYTLLLGEGARLGNQRFLLAARGAGYCVTLALVDHELAETWREARSNVLQRTQNEAWVRGRHSASVNLARAMESHSVQVVRGHPDALLPVLKEIVSECA